MKNSNQAKPNTNHSQTKSTKKKIIIIIIIIIMKYQP